MLYPYLSIPSHYKPIRTAIFKPLLESRCRTIKLPQPLAKDEQEQLFNEYKETRSIEAREKLILHNLRLVGFISSKYRNDKIDHEDIFQIGVIGLIRAIEGFDSDKGIFSSYAIHWIRQAITRGIEDIALTIRVPSHMLQTKRDIISTKEKLENKLGREPTLKEISLQSKRSIKEIDYILNVSNDPLSFQMRTGTNEDTTLKEIIADDKPTPDEVIESKLFMEEFNRTARSVLSELEYKTLTMYLGIGIKERTLKEIADKFNLKDSYIHATKNRALIKLKRTRLISELEEETIYYRSIDYSQPNSNTNKISSPVENIVLQRERMLDSL